jgi:hypothetical protein
MAGGPGTSVHDSPLHKLYEHNRNDGLYRIYEAADATWITG